MNYKWPLFLLALILIGCTEDDDEQQPVSNDPTMISGRFSDHLTCTITAVPSAVGLSSYYSKYLNCSGIPVIGSSEVPDEAFYAADETVEFMLTGMAAVRTKLVSDGNYIALYPPGGCIDDLPEPFGHDCESAAGAYTWNPGSNQLRAIANDSESLICNPGGPTGHIFVHEMAHMIHIGAHQFQNNSFNNQLSGIYNQSLSGGKWDNTYGSTNERELLAEAVTIYYGVNWIGPEGGDGFRNEVGSRGELQSYDNALYSFVNEHFFGGTDLPGCRNPVISGATAVCPNVILDVDGNEYEVVNIGPMCWMKENLRTTHYRDGSPIAHLTENTDWQNTTSGAWANYDNDPENDVIYGKLYNGHAFMSGKLCPQGWHEPSLQELQDLINYAGGDHGAAALRSLNLWQDGSQPTNMSNFSALPAGRRAQEGFFGSKLHGAFFGSHSVTVENESRFFSKNLFFDQEYVFTDADQNNAGVSCRCIKD